MFRLFWKETAITHEQMHSIFLSYLQGGGGGDYTMKRRLSWEIQMSNSAHWEVCWCVNLVSLKQIYDTFPFFKPAMCILLQWWMLILHIARFSHFWCQHVDEYSLWAKRSGFRLLCLRPFFFNSWMFMMSKTEAIPLYGDLR